MTMDLAKEKIMSLTELSFPDHCADYHVTSELLEYMSKSDQQVIKAGATTAIPSNLCKSKTSGKPNVLPELQLLVDCCSTAEGLEMQSLLDNMYSDTDHESLKGEGGGEQQRSKRPNSNVNKVLSNRLPVRGQRTLNKDSDVGSYPSKRLKKIPPVPTKNENLSKTDHSSSPIDQDKSLSQLISEAVALKRASDTQWKLEKRIEVLDLYLQSCLKFIEAGARYEHQSRSSPKGYSQDIHHALKLYRDLVTTNSMLPYYISNCYHLDQTKRAVLGYQCSAIVYARIWLLTVGKMANNFEKMMQSKPIDAEKNRPLLQDIQVIFKFNEHYSMVLAKCKGIPMLEMPEHPFKFDPLLFVQHIKRQIEVLESDD